MNITKIIDCALYGYLANHEDEDPVRWHQLMVQIKQDQDLQDRKNMNGHATSSFMLLSPCKTKILMIYHKRLEKWLCPGGHYEGQRSLQHNALKELNEETGFPLDLVEPWDHAGYPLIDIDTHEIPENLSKGEGIHLHHDFLFVGIAKEEVEPVPQLEEVNEAKWTKISSLLFHPDERVKRAVTKITDLLGWYDV